MEDKSAILNNLGSGPDSGESPGASGQSAAIVQLMPAPGWEIVYLDDQNEESFARLVGWGLTENGDVRGLVVASDGDVIFADTVEGFQGYSDRGDANDVVHIIQALKASVDEGVTALVSALGSVR